jgi:hypothetical protein
LQFQPDKSGDYSSTTFSVWPKGGEDVKKFHERGIYKRTLSTLGPVSVVTFILTLTVLMFMTMESPLSLPIIRQIAHAATGMSRTAVNEDCTLIVPADPLSAQGLATPYQLVATNLQNGPCNETNPAQAAFVQGAILDPVAGKVAIYNPLVISQGVQAAVLPTPPFGGHIPPQDVVALWFGSNGQTLTLQDTDGSLQAGNCVNGSDGSLFGQFAYCNAPAFFAAMNSAIQAGKLVPPALGIERDNMICPTVRDFSLVDEDQSDNVTTTYLVTSSGEIEQNTRVNAQRFPGRLLDNGSDNSLLDAFVDPALGCKPWLAPDLADPGSMAAALPLNEVQADMLQGMPMALVPNRDPMAMIGAALSLDKLNAYRAGVDQPPSLSNQDSDTGTYCAHLLAIAPTRLQADAALTKRYPSPDPAVADSLLTFLAQRFVATYGANGLDCSNHIQQPDPITVLTNNKGVAVQALLDGRPLGASSRQESTTPTTSLSQDSLSFDFLSDGIMMRNGCHDVTTVGRQSGPVALPEKNQSVTMT